MGLRPIKDENSFYVELPKDKIKFVSKEAEMMFDLSLENDYLEQENQELKKDIKNIIRILNKNCDELETTEEEFESLKRWNK